MKYRNTKTGAIIETGCKISGENWEAVQTAPKAPAKKKAKGE